MHTVAFLTKPVPGMTRDEFIAHYRDIHYPLSSSLPGLISYQQSVIEPDDGAWPATAVVAGYAALSLYTFESRAAADAAFASAEGKAVDADTPLFMEWTSVVGIHTEVVRRFEREGEIG